MSSPEYNQLIVHAARFWFQLSCKLQTNSLYAWHRPSTSTRPGAVTVAMKSPGSEWVRSSLANLPMGNTEQQTKAKLREIWSRAPLYVATDSLAEQREPALYIYGDAMRPEEGEVESCG